jgi:hypothetical protein
MTNLYKLTCNCWTCYYLCNYMSGQDGLHWRRMLLIVSLWQGSGGSYQVCFLYFTCFWKIRSYACTFVSVGLCFLLLEVEHIFCSLISLLYEEKMHPMFFEIGVFFCNVRIMFERGSLIQAFGYYLSLSKLCMAGTAIWKGNITWITNCNTEVEQ